jgi:isopentenyl diphosphate isomerase/L-lactate dehydrogenase-like FMN-dependent dehydrogenase
MEPTEILLNADDYEAAAERLLSPGSFGFYAGGANDESTLRDNLAAFAYWYLRPRVLADVAACDTATTVLGHELSMPLLIAPLAFQRVAHPAGEVGMARAARAVGTIMCLSTNATASPAEVAAAGSLRWYQSYAFRDEGLTRELIAQAREDGFTALVLTVDSPVRGRRERDLRTSFDVPSRVVVSSYKRRVTPHEAHELVTASLTWSDVERFVSDAGLPVILKGILTGEDARLACEYGAAALVVSNHGGRQLDGVLATIDALPGVAEAVDGRLEILLDGGVRRGTDVVKALALGAQAVLVGRPPFWGLVVDGEAGATRVLELLREEILQALQLVGCRSPSEVTEAHVTRRP